jgi:hypothetical protein
VIKAKPLPIICERTTKTDNARRKTIVVGSYLFRIIWEKYMEIITTGQIFLSNYELSRFLK